MLYRLKWGKLSIRTQLILLMAALLGGVGIATLGLVNWFDIKERQTIAIEQAQTLGRSLNNDLLNAVVNPEADTFADLTFRVSGFTSVDALVLRDQNKEAIFSYGSEAFMSAQQLSDLNLSEPQFSPQGHLLLKMPVQAEGYQFGESIIVINPERYKTKLREKFETLLWIFLMELSIGLLIAWTISKKYTRPFQQLALAMAGNDIDNNRYQLVETQAQNEVQQLFGGYNKMIAQIQETTEHLNFQSRHDSLTGLFNRFAIDEVLTTALNNESDVGHVLINMDIDQFKLVNDSVGHVAGDELLKMIALSCRHMLIENAVMARVGGDDFYILFYDTTEDEGIAQATRILHAFKDFRFCWEGESLSVSASMGLVAFRPCQYTLKELVNYLDLAFYAAKASGRNKLHVYHCEDQQAQRINTEIQIAGYIKEALNSGPARFELFAQDIVPLQEESDKVSYEVLLRMWDSNGEFLSPDSFLSTAERYQMMVDIDMHVLWIYLEMVTARPEHIEKLQYAHINLSGGTLNHPDFQAKLKNAVKTFDFPWDKLELEITETSAVGDFTQASEFINYCRKMGIGLALDDFGTGMSSFEYLKKLPFDVVKIDGSFVRDMLTDPVDHAMISYTHAISQLRNQKTVAEYVETEQDVAELRKIGITYGQGYYLGKPRPLLEWLK